LLGRVGAFFWDGNALANSILFGRVSEFFWDEDPYLWDSAYSYEPEPGDTNWYFGGGARISLTDRLDLVGDWTRYKLETTDADIVSLGFTYRF
jgi:hypothetical protein